MKRWIGTTVALAALIGLLQWTLGAVVGANEKLGVSVIPVSELKTPPVQSGLLVTAVTAGSPAANVGIKAGDVILEVNGDAVTSDSDLAKQFGAAGGDGTFAFTAKLWSEGGEKSVTYSSSSNTATAQATVQTPAVPPQPHTPPRIAMGMGGGMAAPGGAVLFTPNQRPWLGIHIGELTEALAQAFGVDKKGVLIQEVIEDSPAEKAGLRAGDVIVRFGGQEVGSIDELFGVLDQTKVDEGIDAVVVREGEQVTLNVAPTKRPDQYAGMFNQFAQPQLDGQPGAQAFRYQFHLPPGPQPQVQGNVQAWPFSPTLPGVPWQEQKAEMQELRKQLQALTDEIRKLRESWQPKPQE